MEPVVAAAEGGERQKEESELKLDKVEAGGKLQEEALSDEIQDAGNEEVNGKENGVIEEAKEFRGSLDRDQEIEDEEGNRSVEGIEETEKIEGPEDKNEPIEVEKHRAATDDGIDELKEESDVKDGDDKVEEAEIEEPDKAVFIDEVKQELPSKEVAGGVIRQDLESELGEVEDLKSAPTVDSAVAGEEKPGKAVFIDEVKQEMPSKEVAGGVIRQELEPEVGKVEDLKSAPTVDSAVAGEEIEQDARDEPEKGSGQAENNVVKESDRSGLLGLALRFLPKNLDSWASGVAFGIVTTCSMVVLWEKYYSSRRKV